MSNFQARTLLSIRGVGGLRARPGLRPLVRLFCAQRQERLRQNKQPSNGGCLLLRCVCLQFRGKCLKMHSTQR
jgi:hypothetical protein